MVLYEIVEIKREEITGKWHFVARPVWEHCIEFVCNDDLVEQAAWNAARSGDSVELEFSERENREIGKTVLTKIATPRTGYTAQATIRHE